MLRSYKDLIVYQKGYNLSLQEEASKLLNGLIKSLSPEKKGTINA